MAISAEHTLRRRSRLPQVRAARGPHSMTLEPQWTAITDALSPIEESPQQ